MEPPAKKLKISDPFYSEVYLFSEGLITRTETQKDGKKAMKAACRECTQTWVVTNPKGYSSTTNYRRHYLKKHPAITIDAPPAEEVEKAAARKSSYSALKQSSISIFAQSAKPSMAPTSYKRPPHEPFNRTSSSSF
jgi:hypothetical protein